MRSDSDCTILALHCQSYQSMAEPMTALLKGLLFQALQSKRMGANIQKRLLSLKAQSASMSDISFESTFKVVDDTIRGIPRTTFFILDGVDELDSNSTELETLLRRLGDLSRSSTHCKVLISSRTTMRLKALLNDWEMMEITTADSMSDIATFLDHKLDAMEYLGDHRDEVKQKLLSRSKGLFLWVDLAISELCHLRTWNEVEVFLEKGNPGLDNTYASIIEELDISSAGLYKIRADALPLASVSRRPLKPEEMMELLAIKVPKGCVDEGSKLLGGWTTLLQACGPFLQLNDFGAIELIHVSAKEFLRSYPWQESRKGECRESAEVEMACRCLSYLNFVVSERTLGADSKIDVKSLCQHYRMLEYASQFCGLP